MESIFKPSSLYVENKSTPSFKRENWCKPKGRLENISYVDPNGIKY